MRDLDQSDVDRDAQNMMDEYYQRMWYLFDDQSDAELGRTRYNRGAEAREGCLDAIMVVSCIDFILLHRMVTTLCEGCLGRTGCDMCCSSYYDEVNPFYDDQHFERFGRPEFPNEY